MSVLISFLPSGERHARPPDWITFDAPLKHLRKRLAAPSRCASVVRRVERGRSPSNFARRSRPIGSRAGDARRHDAVEVVADLGAVGVPVAVRVRGGGAGRGLVRGGAAPARRNRKTTRAGEDSSASGTTVQPNRAPVKPAYLRRRRSAETKTAFVLEWRPLEGPS